MASNSVDVLTKTQQKQLMIKTLRENIDADSIKHINDGLASIASVLQQVHEIITNNKPEEIIKTTLTKYKDIERELLDIQQYISGYKSMVFGVDKINAGYLKGVLEKFTNDALNISRQANSIVNENKDNLNVKTKNLVDNLGKIISLNVLQDIAKNYNQVQQEMLTVAKTTATINDIIASSANIDISEYQKVAELFSALKGNPQILANIHKTQLQSVSKQFNDLHANIVDINRKVFAYTNNKSNYDILNNIRQADKLFENLKTGKTNKQFNDYHKNISSINTMVNETLTMLASSSSEFNMEDFKFVFNKFRQVQKEYEISYNLENKLGDYLNTGYVSSKKNFASILEEIHNNFASATNREIEKMQIEFANIKNNISVNSGISAMTLNAVQLNRGYDGILPRLQNSVVGNNTSVFSGGFANSVMAMNRGFVISSDIGNDIEADKSQNSSHFTLANITNEELDKFQTAVTNDNNNVLDTSSKINKYNIKHANANDLEIVNQVREQIEISIRNTIRVINATKMIDPNDKLIPALKSQLQSLEDEAKDIDEAKNSKSVGFFRSIFNTSSDAFHILQTALGFLGVGGAVSLAYFGRALEERYTNNGKALASNYLTNASMGASMDFGANGRVFDLANKYYGLTAGQIGFDRPTQLYRNLAKTVGGAYGIGQNHAAKDMDYFTRQLIAPAEIYGLDDGTLSDSLNAFYKNGREDSEESINSIYQVMENAKKANVPVGKYMREVANLTNVLRKMGVGGKLSIAMVDYMTDRGMRVETATHIVTNIANVQYNFAQNKMNSYYTMMSGQTNNFWSGIVSGMLTHDSNGDPINGRYNMIGKSFHTKLNMLNSAFGATPNVGNFVMMDSMLKSGMTQQTASTVMSLLREGKTEDVGILLEGKEEEKLANNMKAKDKLKEFDNELEIAKTNLSEQQQIMADVDVYANQLAQMLTTKPYKTAMDDLHKSIQGAIHKYADGFKDIIKKLGEIAEIPAVNDTLLLAAENPLKALLLGGLAYSFARSGAKRLGKSLVDVVMHRGGHGGGNHTSGSGGLFTNLRERASKLFKGLSKKTVKARGLGKSATMLALGLTFLGLGSDSAEASALADSEGNEPEDYADGVAELFNNGTAKVTLVDKDGKPYSLHRNSPFLDAMGSSSLSTLGYVGGIVGGALVLRNLIKRFMNKNKAIVNKTNVSVNNSKNLQKGIHGLMDGIKSNLALSGLFAIFDEMRAPGNFTMGEHAVRIGVDTAVYGLVPTLVENLVSRIPGVGKYLAIPAGIVAGGLSSNVGDSIKNMLGVGDSTSTELLQFIRGINENTDMYGKDIMGVINSDTEQGMLIREFMKNNGIDYEKLDSKERAIFAKMMEHLTNAHMGFGALLAMGIQAFKNYKRTSGQKLDANGKVVELNKDKTKEIKDTVSEAYDSDFNTRLAAQAEEAAIMINEIDSQLENTTDESEKAKLLEKKDKLSAIIQLYEDYCNDNDDNAISQLKAELKANIDSIAHSGAGMRAFREKDFSQDEQAVNGMHNRWEGYASSLLGEMKKHYEDRLTNDAKDVAAKTGEGREVASYHPGSPTNVNNKLWELAVQTNAELAQVGLKLPTDWIYAQMFLETGGDTSDLAELHNYGGLKYGDIGHGKDDRGHTYFVNDAEYAHYYAKTLAAYQEDGLFAAGNIQEFAAALKHGGYYTSDEIDYANGLIGALNGAVSTNDSPIGTFDFSKLKNIKPPTFVERAKAAMNNFRDSLGSIGANHAKTGNLVDGMYVSNLGKFESIDDVRKRYQQQSKSYNYSNNITQRANDSAKQAEQDSLIATQNSLYSQQESMRLAQDAVRRAKNIAIQNKENIAGMYIAGTMKDGKSYDEMIGKLNEVLNSLKCEVKLSQTI